MANTLPSVTFFDGRWRNTFEEPSWESGSSFGINASGAQYPFTFGFAEFDIDNDGVSETVVLQSHFLRSALIDSWHVFTAAQFRSAMREGFSTETLAATPELGLQSAFMSVEVSPTELIRWRHLSGSYVIMREQGFPGRGRPNSLVVARLKGSLINAGDAIAQHLQIVCRIR